MNFVSLRLNGSKNVDVFPCRLILDALAVTWLNVMALNQRWFNIHSTLCACWKLSCDLPSFRRFSYHTKILVTTIFFWLFLFEPIVILTSAWAWELLSHFKVLRQSFFYVMESYPVCGQFLLFKFLLNILLHHSCERWASVTQFTKYADSFHTLSRVTFCYNFRIM